MALIRTTIETAPDGSERVLSRVHVLHPDVDVPEWVRTLTFAYTGGDGARLKAVLRAVVALGPPTTEQVAAYATTLRAVGTTSTEV